MESLGSRHHKDDAKGGADGKTDSPPQPFALLPGPHSNLVRSSLKLQKDMAE